MIRPAAVLGSVLAHALAVGAVVVGTLDERAPASPIVVVELTIDVSRDQLDSLAAAPTIPAAAAAPATLSGGPAAAPMPAKGTVPDSVPPRRPRPAAPRPTTASIIALPASGDPGVNPSPPVADPSDHRLADVPASGEDQAPVAPPAAPRGAAAVATLTPLPLVEEDRRAAPLRGGPHGDNRPPSYPLAARLRSIEGRVVLRVGVTADGSAMTVAVTESSGWSLLDAAAREAVQRWRFEPARRRGTPVADEIDVPVTFRLTDDSASR
ncbi:MAG: energy transducer TonB [Alphaproteobacteria bacterium]|nr:energy transducer TonB [Alphaproteobacteria bacterium]